MKKTMFQKDMSLIAEDSSEESAIEYAETSDEDGVSNEIIEGDFVIVKVAGKSRVVHYIARIDVVGKYEYEGIFIHKVSGRVSAEGDDMIFVLNDDDEALFPADDIVQKLPQGNSSVTRVTFCNFWTLKSNILFTILLFSNPSCVCWWILGYCII